MNGISVVFQRFVRSADFLGVPQLRDGTDRIRQTRAGSDASLAEFQRTIPIVLRETGQALARYAAAFETTESAQNAAEHARQRFPCGREIFPPPNGTGRRRGKRWRHRMAPHSAI